MRILKQRLSELQIQWINNNSNRTDRIGDLISVIAEACSRFGYKWCGDAKGLFLRYFDGVYRENVVQALNKKISEIFQDTGIKPRKSMIVEVKEAIKRQYNCMPEDFDQNSAIINFKNGLFNTSSWTLEPHRQNYHSRIQIPVKYNSVAYCPKFTEFLDYVVENSNNPEEMKQTILEMFGYCFTTDVSFGKAFILHSEEPDTGKSTILDILVFLVGSKNCSKTTLDNIAHNRFGKHPLAYKIMNYFPDLPSTPIEENGILKDLITDKEFSFEGKGLPIQKHKNIIKLIFSCNELPPIKKMTLPFAKRWVLLHFNHVIQKENRKLNWAENNILIDENELEGIVNLSINALKSLYQRKSFLNSSEQDIMHKWSMDSNIIYRFIRTVCTKTNDKHRWIEKRVMFSEFKKYCGNQGYNCKIALTGFSQGLKRLGFSNYDAGLKNAKRNRYYAGLTLK